MCYPNTLPAVTPENALFPLGHIVATPGALDLLDRSGTNGFDLIRRHQKGDWGNVPPEDAAANQEGIRMGFRLLSSYFLNEQERLWIITEADRSVTTLLLPEEY